MFQALNCATLKTSELLAFNPTTHDSDFEQLEIFQRQLSSAHADQFDGTISRRFAETPHLPVLETLITVTMVPKKGKSSAVIKAINSGKVPNAAFVSATYIDDGQHRVEKLKKFLTSGLDPLVMVVFAVCDEDEQIEMFVNVNGRAKRPSPAITDLQLARKFSKGSIDSADRLRGYCGYAAWHLATAEGWAYANLIERPMSRPPFKGTVLRFHRTAGALKGLFVHLGELQPYEIELAMQHVITYWKAVEAVLTDVVFGSSVTKKWAHPHVFNIITEGLIVPLLLKGRTPASLLTAIDEVRGPLQCFLAKVEQQVSLKPAFDAGFVGLGGSSSERPFVEALNSCVS